MPWERRPDNPARIKAPQPAPGKLEIVQAFANTKTPGVETDELATPEGLARWLIRRGLLADGTELGEDDVRRAAVVRWGLRSLLAANSGAKRDPEAVRRLERATAAARLRLSFDDEGPAGVEPAAESLVDALGQLMAIVIKARDEDRWSLFKICARGECRRAFFDTSQRHNGMYCTRRCADRERARAYRRSDRYKRLYRY